MDIYLKLRIGLNCFELLAATVGFFYLKELRNGYWKFFPVYLAIVFLIEVTGEYTGYVLHAVQFNIALYRYFGIPFQYLFFCWLFWKYFQQTDVAKWPLVGAAVYLVCCIVDIIHPIGTKAAFYSFSYMVGSIVLLALVLLFLFKFMRSEEILFYRRSRMFWVATGLLVFYLLSLPLYGLWNTLVYDYPEVFNQYWMVTMVLDALMYLFFTFAFIWGKPR